MGMQFTHKEYAMRFLALLTAMLLWASPAFCDEFTITDKKDAKVKAPPAEISIPLGRYHTVNIDLSKEFNLIVKPDDAVIIRDSNGKKIHMLGAIDGPPQVKLYVIMDNKFFAEYLFNIENQQVTPGPIVSPYVERLTKAYNVDVGKPAELVPLVDIYQRLVDNYDAFPGVPTVWEWLGSQYLNLPNTLSLTRAQIKAIQQETMSKYESEVSFTTESRPATKKVYANILAALKAVMGTAPPTPPVPPTPKASSIWVVLVEEVQERKPDLTRVVGDKDFWNQWGDKVTFRGYDKSGTDEKTSSYRRKSVEAKVNTSESASPWIPTMIIIDKATGKVIDTKPFPLDKTSAKTEIERILGKS